MVQVIGKITIRGGVLEIRAPKTPAAALEVLRHLEGYTVTVDIHPTRRAQGTARAAARSSL
jgi:hypothetical protein